MVDPPVGSDDDNDENNRASGDDGSPETQPAGCSEDEPVTRRRGFTVAGQAIGGGAGALIALPALGFANAPASGSSVALADPSDFAVKSATQLSGGQ